MLKEEYLRALGLDCWHLKKDVMLYYAPDQTFENKSLIDILCLCPKSWENNKKIKHLMFWFLNSMFNQRKSKIIYLAKDLENVEKQLNYAGNLVINFTQSTCQDTASVIKINSTMFESMLQKPQIKKQVMLDVFRNSVSITRS
ncbi:MAG: hypothetical protein EP298_09910 [Gammaproteobacteria bacterium]|nr:MAG: hypothetical protein EP298_09910 [Gammaproteobacteria bacterium]UTW41541.1 hypothetical protein KFE69_08465 [bacterium SCSIO 12844]